ncbi:MAG: fatty acid desaturase [Aequoribacter sp.]|uniref:fatty acid desaturase n=1 Tax=Aequoribacter sp. TaxID=2847771 RepID=UPI003C436599
MSDKPQIRPLMVMLFIGLPILAVIITPLWAWYAGFTGTQWLIALAFLYLNGLGITAGYHRLWAHKAYQAHPVVRFWFAVWGAGALQNSVFVWASDHRRHHRHVDDNDHDPYSAGRGLWFSHIGWMLRDHTTNTEDFSNIKDLLQDPILQWQHKHYVAITAFMNIALPIGIGVLLGDIMGTLISVGLVRLVVNHNVTFFINSLAHYWGTRPYTEANSARDNGFLAFLTYGEGYHNYHHIFQTDYRNGIRWWQWDPTKWLIFGLSKVGLCWNLVRVDNFKIQRAIMDTTFERARRQLEQHDNWPLREMLEHEYAAFSESVRQWRELQSQRYEKHKEALGEVWTQRRAQLQQRWEQTQLRDQLKLLELNLRNQHRRVQLLLEQSQSLAAA